MNWLTRLVSPRATAAVLDPAVRDTLARWRASAPPDPGKTHFETRYVVINTEASGLDLDRDRLLAVAAIAIDGGLLAPRDSYYAELEPDAPAALANLLAFCAAGPTMVFNAAFNRSLLERALARHLYVEPDWAWLDLYWLLPGLYPEHFDRPVRLAEWMRIFGIETFQRHHALGDAWAIAQLALAAQSRALMLGISTPRSLAELERARRQSGPHA